MKKFLLFLGDISILYFSLFLTLLIRYRGYFSDQIDNHLLPFSIIFVVGLLIFYIFNLYNIETSKNSPSFFTSIVNASGIMIALAIIILYLVPNFSIAPKTNLAIFGVIFIAVESIWRMFFNNLIAKSGFKNNTVIVGFNQLGVDLAKFLLKNPQAGYKLRYILDLQSNSVFSLEDIEFKAIESSKDIEEILQKEKIKTVILSHEAYRIPQIIDVFYKNVQNKIVFFNLSSFYEKLSSKVVLDALDQNWFIENINKNSNSAYEGIKRVGDILGSISLGLISLLLYPLIMLAIKWESSGPIFYKQKRTGQGGNSFEIIKFRTMIKNAEKQGALWAQENDPRVTKIGKFLRQTRLDEFPQLLNIFRGEMSFVGPRAERPEFHEKLKQEIPFYEERYLIKPGLSGWAQVSYRYGASVADTKEKLQYDLYYIKNRSLIFDLAIILQTIRIVMAGGGR